METEPQSPQRNHRVSKPKLIQCPRCDSYNPDETRSYLNPQTGEQKNDKGLHGGLIFLAFLLAIWVVEPVIITLWVNILHPDYLTKDIWMGYIIPFCTYPIIDPIVAIIAARIAIPLYRARRRRRLSKTHITVTRFVCWHCKNEWTVTQEPISPASHESESAGQTKRRRSPAGPVSLILLALILLGGISFGIYHGVTGSPSGTSNDLHDVAWAGSEFVVVGDLGTILTSPDGHTWTTQTSAPSIFLYDVAWSGLDFVAVGGDGTILTSPDGHTWTT